MLTGKSVKSSKGNDPPHTLSGKVHRLCALWSAEVKSLPEFSDALDTGFNLVSEVIKSSNL